MCKSGFHLVPALLAAICLPGSAQRFASLDVRSVGEEFAGRRTTDAASPAMITSTLPVVAYGSPDWCDGAIAADNAAEQLYWCNGPAAQGIQRMPFSMIGDPAAAATTIPVPPVFSRVTGMLCDRSVGSQANPALWLTDGYSILRYGIPGPGGSGSVLGPFPNPAGGAGTARMATIDYLCGYLTGYGVVCAGHGDGSVSTFDTSTRTWSTGPLVLPVPAGSHLTGFQACPVPKRKR